VKKEKDCEKGFLIAGIPHGKKDEVVKKGPRQQ
jgi:hypothetical protein